MCIDYRLLNEKLVVDKFPLPRIDDILDGLGRANFFLFSGFHRILLNTVSRELTAFSNDRGSFQWEVISFGLNVAFMTYNMLMTQSLLFNLIPLSFVNYDV